MFSYKNNLTNNKKPIAAKPSPVPTGIQPFPGIKIEYDSDQLPTITCYCDESNQKHQEKLQAKNPDLKVKSIPKCGRAFQEILLLIDHLQLAGIVCEQGCGMFVPTNRGKWTILNHLINNHPDVVHEFIGPGSDKLSKDDLKMALDEFDPFYNKRSCKWEKSRPEFFSKPKTDSLVTITEISESLAIEHFPTISDPNSWAARIKAPTEQVDPFESFEVVTKKKKKSALKPVDVIIEPATAKPINATVELVNATAESATMIAKPAIATAEPAIATAEPAIATAEPVTMIATEAVIGKQKHKAKKQKLKPSQVDISPQVDTDIPPQVDTDDSMPIYKSKQTQYRLEKTVLLENFCFNKNCSRNRRECQLNHTNNLSRLFEGTYSPVDWCPNQKDDGICPYLSCALDHSAGRVEWAKTEVLRKEKLALHWAAKQAAARQKKEDIGSAKVKTTNTENSAPVNVNTEEVTLLLKRLTALLDGVK